MTINKSIVISLKSERKRKQRVISQKINHQFFDAVDGSAMTDEEFNIQEWQKRFLDKRNMKWG